MHCLRCALLVLPILLSGCGQAPSAELVPRPLGTPAAAVAGCWVLEPVRWYGFEPLTRATPVYFDTVPDPTARGVGTLPLRLIDPARDPRPIKLDGWGVSAKDGRIVAGFGNGFGGVEMTLAMHGDTLDGRARQFVDNWPFARSGGRVRGVRTTCPAGGVAAGDRTGGRPSSPSASLGTG